MRSDFREHLFNILPDDAGEILNALEKDQFPSIRFNSRKTATTSFSGHAIAWENNAVQLEENPRFIYDPIWHAGAYYVQESSSMYLGLMLRQWLKHSPADAPLMALDLCAAPGGKSTQILDILPDNALLVSNEMVPKRNAILRENLIRWGSANVIITQNEPNDFRPYAGTFDIVLVDAPCSGEGLFRRDKTALEEWSTKAVEHCALRQQAILETARELVKPGGLLIYSTCTFEPSENEEQVKHLLQQGFELIPAEANFPEITEGSLSETYRFYPHKTSGSGFFIACLKKNRTVSVSTGNSFVPTPKRRLSMEPADWKDAGKWIEDPENYTLVQTPYALHAFSKNRKDELQYFNQYLHISYFGCELGELKKGIFIPAHALALSAILKKDIPFREADRDNALKYLRKGSPELRPVEQPEPGWHIIRFEGLALGWIKVLQDRINNYLPSNWRILH